MKPAALIKASKDLLSDLQDEPSKYAKQAPECISQLLALVDAQANQIKKLQAALIIYRLTLTEAQKTEATPYESMTEKATKAEKQLRAELPEEMA